MDQIREIALSGVLNGLAAPSERRLNVEESTALTVLLDQMAAHYPHQEFGEDTTDIWREAIEMLAVKHTLRRVRHVLGELLIKPGQKFFPHPSEISEGLEVLVSKERQDFLKANPIADCSICDNTRFLPVEQNGHRAMARCQCYINWKRISSAHGC